MQLGILDLEPLAFVAEAVCAFEQPFDDAERFVLPISLKQRVDTERVGVGGQRARPGAEDRPSASHMVELDHTLSDVEGVVVGQGDDACAQHDPMRALACCGQEHLRRRNRLPACGMVLTAPEFVEAEAV